MADTLTQLIAKVQAQLLDAGTLFTAATVTAAARQALADLNRAAPLQAAELITAIADQKEYELSDADPAALLVTDVMLEDGGDLSTELPFYSFIQDGRVFFRLREAQLAGDDILVHYAKPHTISGLDSSTDSTLTDQLNTAIIDGICAYCCLTRASATVESNNVQTGVSANWLKAASAWQTSFNRLLKAASRERTPHGDTPRLTWNDNQHSDIYP